jgi:glycosyltransferase involved in cell wall biosynthesis
MTRVSVVLPTYRRPDFLQRAIESVRRQSIDAWELLVVDDNEPESLERRETERAMALYGDDARIRYLRHDTNRGGGAARNTGISAAGSPFVAFLDDDDEWHETKLEQQLRVLEHAPDGIAAVYCRVRTVRAETGREALTPTDGGSPTVRQLLLRNSIGSTSCLLCRRVALEAVGGFDESLAARQDVDLYVRLAERYLFAFVDDPLITLHLHDRPNIGTDFTRSIEAHWQFLEKYRDLIESDPAVHFARLHEIGKLLVWAKRYRDGRAVLVNAWRLRPTNIDVLGRLAMTFGLLRALAEPTNLALKSLRTARGHG